MRTLPSDHQYNRFNGKRLKISVEMFIFDLKRIMSEKSTNRLAIALFALAGSIIIASIIFSHSYRMTHRYDILDEETVIDNYSKEVYFIRYGITKRIRHIDDLLAK